MGDTHGEQGAENNDKAQALAVAASPAKTRRTRNRVIYLRDLDCRGVCSYLLHIGLQQR